MEPTINPAPAASGKLLAAIGVLVLALGAAYFVFRAPAASPEGEGQEVPVSVEGSFRGSMRQLAASGTSVRCTFTYEAPNSSSTGEVFVADGKVRGNFKVNVTSPAAGTFDAFMIADGEMSWVWTSAMPQGFKVPVADEGAPAPTGEGIDYNQDLDYSCAPWATDPSVFVPPADIAFSDIPVPTR
jgi:hypothetical protein